MVKTGHSLRKQLLLWLLLPLLALLVLDTTILYRLSTGFVQRAFDRDLYESAYDVGQLIGKNSENNSIFTLPQEAKELLLSDKFDNLYYNIIVDGRVVAGDSKLSLDLMPSKFAGGGTYYFDLAVDGNPVRMVSIPFKATINSEPRNIRIQVAETLNRRQQYKGDILFAIIWPQLLLVVLAAVIVWFGVGRGLRPLSELQSEVASRSPRDLSPVNLARSPEEASALVDSINYLLTQLEKVLETQNRFIADAAHQLRTPLAGILAQLELAQNEPDPHELQMSLAQMTASMERLSHLVNQLLALARNQPEAAKALNMVRVDLNELAHQAATEMAPAAVQKEIDIGFEGMGQGCFVEGDTQRLRELLFNLIDNAIRYTQRGGKVTVSIEQEQAQEQELVRLCVEDDGPGIPPDEQEKVFERFHRVVAGDHPNGSGLGLAIVREIALIHNAAVTLGMGLDGKGTCVKVMFQARTEAAGGSLT